MRPARQAAWLSTLLPALVLAFAAPATADEKPFYLKDGDRVVFYGDSITDQRLYTTFVETFVVTRFPKMDVTFVHSGWGGDRVTGGGGGPIDVRLKRDVFAYKPTVITVMLGMNDGNYAPFNDKSFTTYSKGFEHIVEAVKENNADTRMTLIRPSPFDDVTREPKFETGYNTVLVRFGDFVEDLARKNHFDVADLNGPVVAATRKAFASDPEAARKLNADRVHPGAGGQLLMADALLNAWNAPALVSRVAIKIDGDKATSDVEHTKVSDLKASDGSVSWTQLDDALPFPIDLKDPIVVLAVESSTVVKDLDQQPLKVAGLAEGPYTLKIDGQPVGRFSAGELAEGINLATRETPMVKQAANVHALTKKHTALHQVRWRDVQVPLASEGKELTEDAIKALDKIEESLVKKQRSEAQPKPRKFELSKAS